MTHRELKRWLVKQGCVFEPGKGSHQIVRLGNRKSVFPNHGKKEIPKGTKLAIMRDLGLK
ncbi:MAG TPA: type II toxin-antitoxin system HicA family toxin [Bryobacteraceae bacterium]|nr:type II toxin-antitoxin system HicA family toxin [Bryobacteraceae bacterium]